ncbi:MAG TPA: sigma-70 family RNA polymerase sigma factor [Candidatus Alectryocaccobium stercorigallinarum]|nr:sigma-70 family RNA polymerase sigma factor [Candidatus Alectryocaccobium stercorigallinarum]
MNFTEAVKLARAGKESGYIYLYNATYKSKFYLAMQYMKNEDDAQDVIQEAYMKAFDKLDTLEDAEAFPAWLGRIVANTAKNELAKKNPALFSDMVSDDEELDFEESIEDENIDNQPELSYTRQETQELVREMINSLSDEQRLCVLMFHIEGQSIKDIAETLKCSENTVKSRLNYGRKNLKSKAEELQKKGYKLFGIAPVFLLIGLLRREETVMAAEGFFDGASAVSQVNILKFARFKISQNAGEAAAGGSAKSGAEAVTGGSSEGGAGTGSTAQSGISGAATADQTAKTAAAAKAAAGASAKTAAGGILSGAAGKIALGIIIAAAAGTGIGIFAAKTYNDNLQNETAYESVYEQEAESASETEDIIPTETPEATPTPEATQTPEPESEDEKLLEKIKQEYMITIQNAGVYEFAEHGSAVPTGNYRYALVMMEPDDRFPLLLVEQEVADGMYYVLDIGKYDEETGMISMITTDIQDGVSGGYYRSAIGIPNSGYGILRTEVMDGSGNTQISQYTLNVDNTLRGETVWSGRMDQIPSEYTASEITWYDWTDMSGLDGLEDMINLSGNPSETSPESGGSTQEQSTPGTADESPAETALPTDGNRYVFTGTINTYSHDEVLALQGISDPNPGSDMGETYSLIVLDTPQSMDLMSGGGDGLRSGTVSIIDVTDVSGIEQYIGQNLIFSIEPTATYWPSDTSLPLGEPSTADVHVLG